jgi:hypothetical protein
MVKRESQKPASAIILGRRQQPFLQSRKDEAAPRAERRTGQRAVHQAGRHAALLVRRPLDGADAWVMGGSRQRSGPVHPSLSPPSFSLLRL